MRVCHPSPLDSLTQLSALTEMRDFSLKDLQVECVEGDSDLCVGIWYCRWCRDCDL